MNHSKKSLGQIVMELEAIAEQSETSESPQELFDAFNDLKGELADKVDSWVAYIDGIETYRENVEKKLEVLNKRKKTLNNLEDRLKNYLVHVMETTSMPYLRGSENSLKIYRNSQPKLDLKLPVERVSFSSCLKANGQHEDLIKDFPEFLKETKVLVIDTDSIKKALQAGRNINFAELSYGQHVRIV